MEIIRLFKEDKTTAFIILFWAMIFAAIPMAFVKLMSIKWQSIIIVFLIEYIILNTLISSFRSNRLYVKVIKQTIYFTFASFISFITISTPVGLSNSELLQYESLIAILFLGGMILPYLFFLYVSKSKRYKMNVRNDIDTIRLSVSIMIAVVTIQYAITPYLILDDYLRDMIHLVTLIPFAMNVILICVFEYIKLSKTVR